MVCIPVVTACGVVAGVVRVVRGGDSICDSICDSNFGSDPLHDMIHFSIHFTSNFQPIYNIYIYIKIGAHVNEMNDLH